MKNNKQIKLVIFDWAGTTVDYGCFAPLEVFIKIFQEKGINITYGEAREPMGLSKIDHIEAILKNSRITDLWKKKYNREWNKNDISDLYFNFEKKLFEILENYTTPISGIIPLAKKLRDNNIKIGSTTGYTRKMLDIVIDGAKKKGYSPDIFVTPTETSVGRPYPYMIYENMSLFNIKDPNLVVKIGDTISDIKEGINAGVWTIGVIKGSNELGLREDEVNAMDKKILGEKMRKVKEKMILAGAHMVIDDITEVYAAIKIINQKLEEKNPYLLLTPGPLTTTKSVRKAMMKDLCTWDDDYNNLVQDLRKRLLDIAYLNSKKYSVVLIQGSGTFSVEAVIGGSISSEEKLLVIANGAYGNRIGEISNILKHNYKILDFGELGAINLKTIEETIKEEKFTHIAMVHCETTTGRLNPINEVGEIAKKYNLSYIIDAMSSFGGISIDMEKTNCDFLISSSNKCIQGVPGFGFIIGKIEAIIKCKNKAKSLSLDLYSQWKTMNDFNGKWRFTSPTHVVRAFYQALLELENEGGIKEREKRYKENNAILLEGMKKFRL
ncbi:2-aminoethylphosphonate--pyruvate transaminase [Fusobacterium sp. IOR10]|uniref:2-aminoethylphosphonate--pyruvate transaminase n=1 Tax=Fusobacterium sp. IOR10 TaxID=2665157 RepID=UPI00193FE0DF|nr:2-aminoethylphosphonate--pyruvate transaminase [Fusobacterium sp. IOR10]